MAATQQDSLVNPSLQRASQVVYLEPYKGMFLNDGAIYQDPPVGVSIYSPKKP